jgi:hypothetical protein
MVNRAKQTQQPDDVLCETKPIYALALVVCPSGHQGKRLTASLPVSPLMQNKANRLQARSVVTSFQGKGYEWRRG